ncbi:MAG: glycoside hydrolase family 2 protein [Bacteroidales bacterium]|nr:glycoside hydrolase family 2 protein [Bacteroidales bacterium]MDT8431724.1 glycoside hydrolase family 2 protein [Bacteroidales bacterium]
MKTRNFIILLILMTATTISCSREDLDHVVRTEISSGWEMSEYGKNNWIPAAVPGSVHTDLLDNGKIEDPFFRLNEHDLQWIDKKDWIYRTTIHADRSLLARDHIELAFPGLDTYGEVYLNDSLVLLTDNMFREWSVECKGILKAGANELKIILRSPVMRGIEKYDALPYQIPVSDNDLAETGKVPGNKKVSIFTRKAGYHFGWDWGPRLVTSGIWKPVFLQGWDEGRINNIQIIQQELTDAKATMKAVMEVQAGKIGNGELVIKVNNEVVARRIFSADDITVFAEIPFEIDSPEWWWPNGMGAQPLYHVKAELYVEGERLHVIEDRIGLRTIELVTDPDEHGNTFHFVVNGKPVFMKGANYIPQDSFLDRVTPERYEHVIQSAVDANMNMLRVWGGGIYEKDIFYELCDEKGILVWQDFMFACSMYPGDSLFLENVRQEAIDNVKRLRNHPSIALWCGNNENLSAWYRWGWRERVIGEQGQEVADLLWKAYQDVFHEILPEVVRTEDGDRYYWASSSSAAMGVPDNLTQGDLHYWGVWWGKEPFSSFRENTGRFMSEYGFQSFPEMKTIREYAVEEDFDIYSDVMKSHQRSSIGNETIELYMNRDYRDPRDFSSFIYVGQVLQGVGIRRAIELHRVQMPYCMGSLYWQINDCWPVASWSGMDYSGRWKAQHYMAREAFKNVIIVPETSNSSTTISVVSDLDKTLNASLNSRIIDFHGEVLWESSREVSVPATASSAVFTFDHSEVVTRPGEVVLEITLEHDDNLIDQALWYYAPPKALVLPVPEVEIHTTKTDKATYRLTIVSDVLVKNIFLQSETVDGFFSNNYFDMVPGKTYTVDFEVREGSGAPGFFFSELTGSYMKKEGD